MSSHFRGADNPNWAFTKETEKLINQQEKKMKLTSKVKGIWSISYGKTVGMNVFLGNVRFHTKSMFKIKRY